MPKFELNKLVRDKLKGDYARSNQKVVYRDLSINDHKRALVRKIIEEALEIELDIAEDNIGELADIQQALNDLSDLCNISKNQLEYARQQKNDRKGGFTEGVFVETIELVDGDKWIEYYRQKPQIFKEIKQ